MPRSVLLLLGDFRDSQSVIDRAASQFDLTTIVVQNYDEVLVMCERTKVVGLLFHTQDREDPAIKMKPGRPWSYGGCVRPIACWRPSSELTQQEMEQMGIYHTLLEPIRFTEVRLSLGFLAQAVARDAPAHRGNAAPPPKFPRILSNTRETAHAGAAA